ncbi:MAG: efflux RND transporter permease subunit [Candidatus Omnitrophica bacterium]|nr:efflux RND transporter permease subunit [Candidatus Omnitrophota bacterium]
MKISEFSVKHSLLVNLISLFILIAGFATIFVYQIRREAFPDVSFDVVVVRTFYAGASPAEVEKLVTVPIEKELRGVDGVEDMSSASIDNLSTIQLELSQDIKDKDKVVDEIRQAVDRARGLPDDAEEPLVTEITSGEIPVIKIALSGDLTEFELQECAEKLEDILEDIKGVSSIASQGWRDSEVWVEVDPDKLEEFHLSLKEIMTALKRRNISIPAGKMRGEEEIIIRTTGEFHTVEEIENVIIRANDMGNWLRIKDVAGVRFYFEDEDVINKSFGTRSIMLTVIKRSSGDTIKIVDDVKRETAGFIQNAPKNLEINYTNDISYYIRRRLGVLRNNGIIGFALVICVLVFFLHHRTAFLTALGIPIAFGATLAVMGYLDISVNLITMFGLIIVLGMLVDDGIIVAENCSRYLEAGMDPRAAAIKGTEEVLKPVVTAVLTTMAAFAPLLFLPGIMGKFIRGIPVIVIIALCASLLEALIILPSHFADFVKRPRGKKLAGKSGMELSHVKWLVKSYTRLLNKALNRRYWVIFGLIIILLGTFMLAKKMNFVLFGSEEAIEQFYIRAEAPVGTNLYKTNELIGQIEKKVAVLPDDQLDSYITQVGMIGMGWMFDEYGKQGSHVAQVTVNLTPFNTRDKTVSEIIENLRSGLKDVSGFEKVYFEKEKEGPPVGKAVAVEIRGEDFTVLEDIGDEVSAYLAGIKGVSDIASSYEAGRSEIRIVVDEEKASSSYLSIEDIASSIRYAFKGGVATSIKPTKAEEEIDVLVRFPEEARDKEITFEKITIPNKYGHLVPLKKVARLEKRTSSVSINHLNGRRVITIRAEVDNKNITSIKVNNLLAGKFRDIPQRYPGCKIEFGGEQKENIETTKNFLIAFGLAMFLIFMILAASFNSLIQPLVVMMAIPFGIIGVVWAFFFHGMPLGFFAMMGVVGLTGIVVNDSIVLVDFINGLRRKGVDRRDSIIKGGQLRLRPVILTTITTSLGLVPTAYCIGGGDPFLKPLALTIVWGIVCATALTLIALPCIYAIIDDITLKLIGHSTVEKNGNNAL